MRKQTRKSPVCLPSPGTYPQTPWHRRHGDASEGDKGKEISRAAEQVSHENDRPWVREKLKLRIGFGFGPDTPATGPWSDTTCLLRTRELHPDIITTPATQDLHPITGPRSPHILTKKLQWGDNWINKKAQKAFICFLCNKYDFAVNSLNCQANSIYMSPEN